jgi:hypothetical protein
MRSMGWGGGHEWMKRWYRKSINECRRKSELGRRDG